MSDEQQAQALALDLLARRPPRATLCPSEVARALVAATNPQGWRDAMPPVHAAIDTLLTQGSIKISWQGQNLSARRGPYRISLSDPGGTASSSFG